VLDSTIQEALAKARTPDERRPPPVSPCADGSTARIVRQREAEACTIVPVSVLGIAVLAGLTVAPAASRSSPGLGSVKGRVLYQGWVPPPVIVFEGGGEQPVLEVERNGKGLRSAVVYLDAPSEPAPEDLPVVGVDQTGWMFRPPVVAVSESQSVRFTNSDGANHSIRSRDETASNQINAFTLGAPYVHQFVRKADPGHPIVVTCDVHAWMIAWVYVFDHPYYAVTDAGGRFEITSVPAGSHRLHVRHPGGGLERDLDVEIVGRRPVPVEVMFDSADLRLSVPSPKGVAGP
jgi:plastocyanin